MRGVPPLVEPQRPVLALAADMILTGPSEGLPDWLRLESWMMHSSELLEAAAYPEEVLKASLTIIQAQVEAERAGMEETHCADASPYLLMVWVQPMAELTEDADETDDETEETDDE